METLQIAISILGPEKAPKMVIPSPTLATYPGANVQQHIKQHGFWARPETRILDWVASRSQPGITMVDVGANTGYFSWLALARGLNVIAIEANPIHTPYINATLAANTFTGTFKYIQAFVSDRPGEVPFDGWSGYTPIMATDASRLSVVPTVRLDAILPSETEFLKIDVEGAEPEVFASLGDALQSVKYIMFELTYITSDKVDAAQMNLARTIQDANYTLYNIEEHGERDVLRKITDLESEEINWTSEYFNTHKRANPSITSAGTNILAVRQGAPIPTL
jgi:FkbM family methyltransferase